MRLILLWIATPFALQKSRNDENMDSIKYKFYKKDSAKWMIMDCHEITIVISRNDEMENRIKYSRNGKVESVIANEVRQSIK